MRKIATAQWQHKNLLQGPSVTMALVNSDALNFREIEIFNFFLGELVKKRKVIEMMTNYLKQESQFFLEIENISFHQTTKFKIFHFELPKWFCINRCIQNREWIRFFYYLKHSPVYDLVKQNQYF